MKYCSETIKIGLCANELFSMGMVVLFCKEAPDTFSEYCVIHKHEWQHTDFGIGDKFALGNHIYEITALGDNAIKNMNELGHVTLYFDGASEARMSGYIHLKGDSAYIPEVGEEIVIF